MTSKEPQRLPQEIYVRRRVAAAAVLVVVVLLLVWLASVLFGGDDPENPEQAAATTTAEQTESSAAETHTSTTTETSTSVTSSASAEPTETTEAAADKKTCELDDLKLTVRTNPTTVTGNQQPEFFLAVENPTGGDCVIDTSEEQLRFEVYDLTTNQRLWSDIDCNRPMLSGKETFEAGQTRQFSAVWSRTTSAPGACEARQSVPAGGYFLHGVFGNNASPAETFNVGD